MADGVALVETNIHFLHQGIRLLKDLDDERYTNTDISKYESPVGKQFRHVLEHYQAIVNQTDGRIDYDDRERNVRIESDRKFAISHAEDLLKKLQSFSDASLLQKKVLIKNNEGNPDKELAWSESSLQREFQFLISHTVHHYALIAIILRIQGYQPAEEFAVAPSTLRYQQKLNEATG